jgi:hypothetical protein
MKSLIAVSVAFLTGSAITAMVLSWDKHEPVSASVNSYDSENNEVDARLVQIYERLTKIEALLAQSQKQISFTQSATTDVNKREDNDALDVKSKANMVDAANTVVEEVLQRGTVTPSDFNTFAAATIKLSKEEREKLLSKVTMSINNGQVRVEPN